MSTRTPFRAALAAGRDHARRCRELGREASRLLPVVRRKPAIALRWLSGAWKAHALLVVGGLFTALALPPILDATLPRIYPEVERDGKLLGLIPRKVREQDPRVERRKIELTVLAWASVGSSALLALWIGLPGAVTRCDVASRARERKADSLLPARPDQSTRLYRSALRLATRPEHEAALQEKVRRAEGEAEIERPASSPTVRLPGSADAGETVAGRYELQHVLSRGGMGIVYRARDRVLDREVALKRLPPEWTDDSELVVRFRQEARALARLAHPSIVQVHDLVEDRGHHWMAMELVAGGDLKARLEQRAPLLPDEAITLALPVAEALHFAHGRGVVHRDVKPANVLLTRDGRPKLADFGISKTDRSAGRTRAGTVLGSPEYLSPEQASGRAADARSDLYSFGVMLYEMLTGRLPFEGDTASVLAAHITQPAPAPGGLVSLPRELDRIVLEMLEKEPDRRPPDLQAVVRRLRELAPLPA